MSWHDESEPAVYAPGERQREKEGEYALATLRARLDEAERERDDCDAAALAMSGDVDRFCAERDDAIARAERAEEALRGIAPWLSASLEESEPCAEYRAACDAVFRAALDRKEPEG